MRWLESSPQRYDAGMRLLTLGRVERLHRALAAAAAPEPRRRVLEIGCGTGALTALLAGRGAAVTAVDHDPAMLEQARRRGLGETVTWLERTAAEIDGLPAAAFDAVVAGLCLSEMAAGERAWVLRQALERLRPGGVLAAGDEVRAQGGGRLLQALLRGPQAALGWLLVGSVSRPIPDLATEVGAAGFEVRSEKRWLLGTLAMIVAERRR